MTTDNFPPHLKRFNNDPGVAKVIRIFNEIVGRDPTMTEAGRFRLFGEMTIRDQAREASRKDLGAKSEHSLMELARNTQKEPGVSLVSTYNRQCGIATYTENLYGAIRKNYKASVLSEMSRDRGECSCENGVVKCWGMNTDDYKFDLTRAAVEAKNKVLHIQHEWGLFKDNDYFLRFMSNLKNIGFKTIATLHTVVDGRREKLLAPYFDVFIVHSEAAASCLYGRGVNNVTVIPHGTEEPLLDITREKALEFVNTLIPLNPGDIFVSYPGFISPNKMQLEVLKAVKIACEKIPNLKFLLIGSHGIGGYDGGLLSKLQEFQTANDQIKVIQKFTTKEEMAMILIASDFCVQNYGTSFFSTSGMSHLLMSYGVPSVSSTARILDDLTSSMSLKVDGGRPDKIAEAIIRLAGDSGMRENFKNAALSEGKRTTWDKVAEVHVSVYKSIAAR
jgi:glycosyltransferase involved in cell wall biosynthesis